MSRTSRRGLRDTIENCLLEPGSCLLDPSDLADRVFDVVKNWLNDNQYRILSLEEVKRLEADGRL